MCLLFTSAERESVESGLNQSSPCPGHVPERGILTSVTMHIDDFSYLQQCDIQFSYPHFSASSLGCIVELVNGIKYLCSSDPSTWSCPVSLVLDQEANVIRSLSRLTPVSEYVWALLLSIYCLC